MGATNVSSLPSEALMPELLNLLKEGNPDERVDCARLLGRWRHPAAREALQEHLGDREEDVCVAAAEAMGVLADTSMIQLLGQMAREHPDGEARIAAVRALARLEAPEASRELLALITLAEASQGLENGWNPAWDVQRVAISVLDGSTAQKAVPALLDLLVAQEADDLEPEILAALARSGASAEDAFRQLLAHASARLRRRTARAIRHWQCKFAPVLLFRFLQDGHPRVRVEALSSLAYRAETAYVRDMILCLEDPDSGVRSAAIDAIQTISGKLETRAIERIGTDRIKKLFKDDDPRIRRLGWQLLARQSDAIDEELALWLEHHAEDLHAGEITTALDSLAPMAPDHDWHRRVFETLWPRWDGEDAELGTALARQWQHLTLEPADSEKLQALLSAKLACVRLAALQGLVKNTAGQNKALAVEWLGGILHGNPDTFSRSLSGSFSGNPALPTHPVPGQSVSDRLIPVQNLDATNDDDESDVIHQIMDQAYPEQSNDQSEPLMQATDGPRSTLDAVARANVSGALVATGENDQHSRLDNMLDDLPEDMGTYAQVVREHLETGEKLSLNGRKKADFPDAPNIALAIRALGESGSTFAVKWLREHLLASDAGMQAEAINSLGRIAERHPDLAELSSCMGPLGTLLSAAPPLARTACARALGSLGHPKALPLLLEALTDTHAPVRIAAISAIGSCLRAPQANFEQRHDVAPENPETRLVSESLHQALSDPEPEVRAAALRLLTRNHDESSLQLILNAALNDPELTELSSRLLAELEPERTVALLTPIIKDPSQARRAVALRLLLSITPSFNPTTNLN
jgi:HEAT repeat protein